MPDATSAQRTTREVRQQQILDAAVYVFAQQGYHAASMDGVAEAAGVSKPMLYLYIGSKEELFIACIRREAARREIINVVTGLVARRDRAGGGASELSANRAGRDGSDPAQNDHGAGALSFALVGAADALAEWATASGEEPHQVTARLMNLVWVGMDRLIAGERWPAT